MKNNKKFLSEIESAFNEEKPIQLNSNQELSKDELIVIKRNGTHAPYDVSKMRRVCMWACDNNENFAEILLSSTRIKLYQKIKIADVYDELIKSAANKISRLYPEFEMIASKLLLLKIYKDAWNIKKTRYPNFLDVVEEGLKRKKYNHDVFTSYSQEELEIIGSYIVQERDFLFTYKSLYTFSEKYCMYSTKKNKLELPQHAYIRIAMCLYKDEPKNQRLELIKELYDILSKHEATMATPIMLNGGAINQQLSSCVLSKVDDCSTSIMDTAKQVAIYSKNKGGNAVDFSSIRSSGSYIHGNDGFSSGPVPFIKIFEATIKAFNQGSTRPGACAIYFPWWHYNFKELVVLKNNTGTEENRARQLKYSVKINNILIQRYLSNQNITLFDPKDTPELLETFGQKFEEKYIEYETKSNIKKQIIPARDLMALLFKERAETGNVYLFHEENVNEASLLNRYVNSSNLCCEIVLPSRASKFKKDYVYLDDKKKLIINEYEAGEIALCNLASINILNYMNADKETKRRIVKNVVRALDNSIDQATYPIKEAELTNKQYRYLGIGVLNMANYLATMGIAIDEQEALEETHRIFDELSYEIILASHELAKLKGSFTSFRETEWANGILPIFKANEKSMKLTKYQPDMNKWKELAEKIKGGGIRNAQLMAIAPTATSGKAINATESIEPIQNFFYKEDGKINLPTLVPNIRKNWKYYKIAPDCDQYMLIKAAAIRQMYLDQAQSINVYFKKVTSLQEFSLFHIWAFSLGIKTFYYCKTLKEELEEICESCS
ncbi:MAG: ribonucleoside-diphosphate reductase subunit alpha [Mycoplasma sp.]